MHGSEVAENTYWGATPVEFYEGGYAQYEHQNWLGTERMRTKYDVAVDGTFVSLPFGDGFSTSGNDNDPYHFAGLDHDYSSNTDHAQFRQYSSMSGRWMSPDPYSGSYSFGNPQTMNRYSYVLNNPLSNIDPSGLDYCSLYDDEGEGVQAPQDSTSCEQQNGYWIQDYQYDDSGDDSNYNPGVATGTGLPPIIWTDNVTGFLPLVLDFGPSSYIWNSGSGSGPSTVSGGGGGPAFCTFGWPCLPVQGGPPPNSKQWNCKAGVALGAVGAALGGPPGSDPRGETAGAIKEAAKSPIVQASVATFIARASARVGAIIGDELVPYVGQLASGAVILSAIKDGVDYYNENAGACQ